MTCLSCLVFRGEGETRSLPVSDGNTDHIPLPLCLSVSLRSPPAGCLRSLTQVLCHAGGPWKDGRTYMTPRREREKEQRALAQGPGAGPSFTVSIGRDDEATHQSWAYKRTPGLVNGPLPPPPPWRVSRMVPQALTVEQSLLSTIIGCPSFVSPPHVSPSDSVPSLYLLFPSLLGMLLFQCSLFSQARQS